MVVKEFFSKATGKRYTMNERLYFILKESKNRVDNKFDSLIPITGAVGSGKTTLAFGFGGVWEEHFFNRTFNLDNIHFRAEVITEVTNKEDNYTEFIQFDEAIQGGSSRDGITKIGNVLRKTLITKRFKRHLLVPCVDNLKELSDKIIERCICWIHVHYDRLPNGTYRRGRAKIFTPTQALKVYEDLKNKKCYKIEEHPIWIKNKMIIDFMNYENIFFDEKEYIQKKSDETNLIEEQENEANNKIMEQRNKLIYYLIDKTSLSLEQIASIVGLTRKTINDIKLKMVAEAQSTYKRHDND